MDYKTSVWTRDLVLHQAQTSELRIVKIVTLWERDSFCQYHSEITKCANKYTKFELTTLCIFVTVRHENELFMNWDLHGWNCLASS